MDASISGLLDKLVDESDNEKQSAGEIIARFEDRGFGPLLLIPSLIALLPTGVIPGVPSICGITLFLICIQVAIGRNAPWLPNKITKQEIDQKTRKRGRARQTLRKENRKVTKAPHNRFIQHAG